MNGSLVVPLIWHLRVNLTDELDLRTPAPDEGETSVSQARAMLLPCVKALVKDFNSRWCDSFGKMMYEKGPRGHPQGFHPE